MDEKKKKLCPYCQRELPIEAPFCWYCTRELVTRPERPEGISKQSTISTKEVLIAGGISLLIIVIVIALAVLI